MAVLGCEVQSRIAVIIARIGIYFIMEQHFHHLKMASQHCDVQAISVELRYSIYISLVLA